MRRLPLGLALVLLLAGPLAGCTGPTGNPNLRPPCQPSTPIAVEIVIEKERFIPGELLNVTLFLNNSGQRAETVRWRSWELSMKSFDGRSIRTYFRDEGDAGAANRSVPPGARVPLQDRWAAFPAYGDVLEPLTPGTYYLCAVMTGPDGNLRATGARPFIADRAPTQV